MVCDADPHRGMPTMVVTLATYVALILGYPLVGEQDIPGAAFYLGWLGSSFLAGVLIPRRWMLLVPSVVCVVLLGVMIAGVSDSQLLADSLSGVALMVLAAGETGGIRLGFAVASRLTGSKI